MRIDNLNLAATCFSNIILADETEHRQNTSRFAEAMQERSVTIAGENYVDSYFVLASKPIEQEGTFYPV
jgi:MoxR-like ATPase